MHPFSVGEPMSGSNAPRPCYRADTDAFVDRGHLLRLPIPPLSRPLRSASKSGVTYDRSTVAAPMIRSASASLCRCASQSRGSVRIRHRARAAYPHAVD